MTKYVLPLTPPWTRPPLTLNQRLHHMKRYKIEDTVRDVVILRCRQQRIPALGRIQVSLLWRPPDRRRRDGDNPFPTIKACTDGLVKAGVIPDDDYHHVTHAGVKFAEPEPGQKTGQLALIIRKEPHA